MALVTTTEGEVQILNVLFGKTAAETLSVRLFVNDYIPVEASTLSSFVEASTYGYTPLTVSASSWTLTAGDPTYGTTPELMFPFSGPAGNMYGYFVVGTTSGKVYWAERFGNGPINIQNVNDRAIVPLKYGLE